MYLVGQWLISIGFARILRLAFSHHHQFRYDPNNKLTKINIYDQFPLVGIQYPAIIIDCAGGEALLRGIGEEVAEEISSPVSINGATYNKTTGVIYSGQLRNRVNISVWARSAYERAQIADWIALFLRHFVFDDLQKEGIFIQDLNFGPQTAQLVGADPIYMTSVVATVLSSFSRTINIADSKTVDGVCITGAFSTLLDGVTLAF